MRFVSINEYDYGLPSTAIGVNEALDDPGTVVLHYVEGFYLVPVADLVTIATTPAGTLILLHKDGTMSTFNVSTDRCRSQHVPLETFVAGPSDGNELVAVWNQYKHHRDRAAADAAADRGEM